jgi:hypothetical protein
MMELFSRVKKEIRGGDKEKAKAPTFRELKTFNDVCVCDHLKHYTYKHQLGEGRIYPVWTYIVHRIVSMEVAFIL